MCDLCGCLSGRGRADDLHEVRDRRLVLLVELAVDARDVGRVVLVVVELHRRRVDAGLERVVGVGQVRQRVGVGLRRGGRGRGGACAGFVQLVFVLVVSAVFLKS